MHHSRHPDSLRGQVVRSWQTPDYSTGKGHPVVFSLAMPPPLLLLQDIIVTFGVTSLLSGAELAIAAGDRVCLVGATAPANPRCCALRPGWYSQMPGIASPNPAPQFTICRKNRICQASLRP